MAQEGLQTPKMTSEQKFPKSVKIWGGPLVILSGKLWWPKKGNYGGPKKETMVALIKAGLTLGISFTGTAMTLPLLLGNMAMHGPSRGPFKGLLGTTKGPPPKILTEFWDFFFVRGHFWPLQAFPGHFEALENFIWPK